jgi:hypothetical protein
MSTNEPQLELSNFHLANLTCRPSYCPFTKNLFAKKKKGALASRGIAFTIKGVELKVRSKLDISKVHRH